MSNSDIRQIDKNMDFKNTATDGFTWYSVDDAPFVFEGLLWRKPGEPFRRVPSNWQINAGIDQTLSWHTTGAMLRFVSDADEIRQYGI